MGNSVSYDARADIEDIHMSNGLTSVFISVLALAISDLAESDHQREFAVWFASHDQNIFGRGTIGFDISKMPWSSATFAHDQNFILRAIAAAKAKTGWNRLGYEPREEWILSCLDQFQGMIQAFVIEHACKIESEIWMYCDRPSDPILCPIHQVYQHEHGCALCNDQ